MQKECETLSSETQVQVPPVNIQLGGDEIWSSDTLTYFGKETRTLLIGQDITDTTAEAFISQVLSLSALDPKSEIHIYMQTAGGSMSAALAMFDTLRITPCPVSITVLNSCSSAGLFLLQAADWRCAFPHATFFYHEPVHCSFTATEHATTAYAEEYKRYNKYMGDIIRERSKMKLTTWKKSFESKTAVFLDVEQALNLNLIDEVIKHRPYWKTKPRK